MNYSVRNIDSMNHFSEKKIPTRDYHLALESHRRPQRSLKSGFRWKQDDD